MFHRFLALFLSLAACPAVALSPDVPLISGRAQVVDGDTLRIGAATIRLHGIDALEHDQTCLGATGRDWACGRAATARLTQLVRGGALDCLPKDHDRYGRIVAACRIGGRDLGATLVEEGLAWAFRRYSDDYADAEAAAKAQHVGLWQGQAQPAWDYRRTSWDQAVHAASLPDCPIKGNISAKGERIYHTPWSAFYGRTRIDTTKGERWFCDEAEAVAAGWRAARSQ